MSSLPVSRKTGFASALLIIGVLLIAATLRAPFTNIAPLLDDIRSQFGLSAAKAGLLTTLPLLAFAAVSPFASKLAAWLGAERALFGAMVILAIGIAVRSTGVEWSLFLGTAIIGAGIAVGNVLLPSLVKRDFPGQVALVTSSYALTMGIGAAVGSAIAVPLAHRPGSGWPLALGSMIVLPIAALALWWPQLRRDAASATDAAASSAGRPIWTSVLAWQVTVFMGLVSFLYYIIAGWLPSVLIAAGYSAQAAGEMHGIMQLASGFPGFVLVPLMRWMKDQRFLAVGVSMLSATALAGLAIFPEHAHAWVALFGFSSGTGIVLGLSFFSLRTANPLQAASLSGMVQCIGYGVAAFGPPAIGWLHELQGNWSSPLLECAALCIIMGCAGYFAGRDARV